MNLLRGKRTLLTVYYNVINLGFFKLDLTGKRYVGFRRSNQIKESVRGKPLIVKCKGSLEDNSILPRVGKSKD